MNPWLNLSHGETAALAVICFAAGLVRGFSGFALSAMVMSVAVLILPPVELIPVLWFLEVTASLMMVRQGFAQADRSVAFGLFLGGLAGWPLGLALTNSLPVATSKQVALVLIMVLALSQLMKLRLPGLATRPGLIATGMTAGLVSGLANVGGMVIALFVLSRDAAPGVMRATLVMYLFFGMFSSLFYLLVFGMMSEQTVLRAAAMIVPTVLGVIAGRALFTERLSRYYRAFCLILLLTLASVSLLREIAL